MKKTLALVLMITVTAILALSVCAADWITKDITSTLDEAPDWYSEDDAVELELWNDGSTNANSGAQDAYLSEYVFLKEKGLGDFTAYFDVEEEGDYNIGVVLMAWAKSVPRSSTFTVDDAEPIYISFDYNDEDQYSEQFLTGPSIHLTKGEHTFKIGLASDFDDSTVKSLYFDKMFFAPAAAGTASAPAAEAEATTTASAGSTLAHWKFQKLDGCYSGKITNDDLTFKDLTGNGNDLITAVEGKGDEIYVFDWDEGNTLGASTSESSLLMNNSKDNAASVDTYSADETSWTGGFTSGKYLKTVDGAPINSMTFDGAYTFEVIFKFSPDFNNDYNRYCGIFSRQGVVEAQNEPPFSLAATEVAGSTVLGEGGSIGVQYVHLDADSVKTNKEFANGSIEADQWVHFMVTSDVDGTTEVYVNGESLDIFAENNGIYVTDPSYSWEVGVGRKSGTDHVGVDTVNENHPEGLIRRLFCGSISEIRVMDKYITIEESLFNTPVKYEAETAAPAAEEAPAVEAPAAEEIKAEPAAEETVVAPAPVVEAETPAEKAPQTFDVTMIAAFSAIISLAGFAVSKKK